MQSFRNLDVWKASYALVLSVYKLTAPFPAEERYGLTSQIRRAIVSIPNNIAEGSKRKTRADFAHFLNMAEGSAAEMECLLMLARDLGYASAETVQPLLQEIQHIGYQLKGLRAKIEQPLSTTARSS